MISRSLSIFKNQFFYSWRTSVRALGGWYEPQSLEEGKREAGQLSVQTRLSVMWRAPMPRICWPPSCEMSVHQDPRCLQQRWLNELTSEPDDKHQCKGRKFLDTEVAWTHLEKKHHEQLPMVWKEIGLGVWRWFPVLAQPLICWVDMSMSLGLSFFLGNRKELDHTVIFAAQRECFGAPCSPALLQLQQLGICLFCLFGFCVKPL